MTTTGEWARGARQLHPADHPAKFTMSILHAIDHVLTEEADRLGRRLRIIDQFAGVGRVHHFASAAHFTVAAELEPEWALHCLPRYPGLSGPVVLSDARHPAFRPASFDVLVESPSYGNRLRDAHEARDACTHTVKQRGDKPPRIYGQQECPKCKGTGLSPRNTYRHKLGRMPSRGTSCTLPFGDKYRRLHADHYTAMLSTDGPLTSEALVVVNVSNYTETVERGGDKREQEQRVTEWHTNELMAQGCNIVRIDRVKTPGYRNGANSEKRTPGEVVLVMRAPKKTVLSPQQLTLTPAARTTETVEVAGGYV